MTPKIYHITSPIPNRYALFLAVDTWVNEGQSCPRCGRRELQRKFPATIEYCGGAVPDLDPIGLVFLARRTVAQELADRFEGIELKGVIFHRGDSFRFGSERRPVQALEYNGPELVEVWFRHYVPYRPELGSLEPRHPCSVCGRSTYYVRGVERIDEAPGVFRDGFNYHRDTEMGIRVPVADLAGHQVFRYGDQRKMVLESVKEYIEDRSFSNAEFIDYGEVV